MTATKAGIASEVSGRSGRGKARGGLLVTDSRL